MDALVPTSHDDEELGRQLVGRLKETIRFSPEDIWHADQGACSFWIFLVNGINRTEEADLALRLLLWKEFFARSEARVRCIQSSEGELFHFCSTIFDTVAFPTLIIGNSPDFSDYVKLDEQALKVLVKNSDRLQQFITGVHAQLRRGISIAKLNSEFRKEHFWNKMSIAYGEIKELLSLSIQCKVG